MSQQAIQDPVVGVHGVVTSVTMTGDVSDDDWELPRIQVRDILRDGGWLMSAWTRKSSGTTRKEFRGRHRFEHWYRDNQVYFITARCRDKFPAFACEEAKEVFWDRFNHYTSMHQFFPWVVSLMNNHYHVLGYCRLGGQLGEMMRKIHGSVAKMVNDLLPQRLVPFWTETGHQDYFDGCIRDEKQCRLAYGYTLTQSVRHGIAKDWREYPHTKVYIDLESGVRRALELKAFLEGVPYKRYEGKRRVHGH